MVEFKVGSYGYIAQKDIEVAMDNVSITVGSYIAHATVTNITLS